MRESALRVLETFRQMGMDRLDLHVLFEAAGNEPTERQRVLDGIEELLNKGLLEVCGSDFYALSEKGRRSIGQS